MKKEKIDTFMFNQVVINTRIRWNQGPHGLNNGLQINLVDKLKSINFDTSYSFQAPI